MASECCLSLTKYFLFLFNLIFFLLGSLVLSLGLWILFANTSIFIPSLPFISTPLFSYLLIISGSMTMSLGFLGCLGSLKTVKCLLAIYFILLTVLLAAQIVGGVLFYTQKSEFVGSLEDHTTGLMKSLGKNDSNLQGFIETLEFIQMEAKCCGWKGKIDWGNSIPCSCYYTDNATVNATNTTEAPVFLPCPSCFSNVSISNHTECSIYEKGCSENITNWLKENVLLISVVILSISAVEICGMILSMYLYKEGPVNYKTTFY